MPTSLSTSLAPSNVPNTVSTLAKFPLVLRWQPVVSLNVQKKGLKDRTVQINEFIRSDEQNLFSETGVR